MNARAVFTAMLPEHLLLLGIVTLLGLAISGRARRTSLGVALLAVAAAVLAAAVLSAAGYAAAPFAGQLSVDPASLRAKALLLALALPVLLMSRGEFDGEEFPLLLLSSLYGAALLQSADSFLTLFLGLELMSLPVYVLVLLAYRRPQSAEAAIKYLILGGAASAALLMGASLLYGASGSLATSTFEQALGSRNPMMATAAVLVIAAFFVKAAIVPFHAWAPDAYEAASVPVTAYMAVIVKAGVLLAIVRLFGSAAPASPLLELLALLPLASMIWGNLAAMRQDSLRRMIAYSSIAHAGYLFYALLGEAAGRMQAVTFYVLAYGLLNLLAFSALAPAADDRERDRLERLKGLFHRSPYSALMIGIAMLSLAGVPPFPGFTAKFLVFKNVVAAGHVLYAVLGLIASYLGLYFYLRVIQFLFMSAPPAQAAQAPRHWALGASVACVAATLFVIVLPGWVIGRL